MYNEIYNVTLPLASGTYTVQGTSSATDVMTYNSQTPDSLPGTGTSTYSQLTQNENGSLTYKIWDWASKKLATYNLPALSSTNAVEYINRINAATSAFDGLNALKTAGNYAGSSESHMFIFGSAGNDQIQAPTLKTSVASIYGGAGNDLITGSALYCILDGGAGANELHGMSGTNYFRMYTGDSGTSTVLADQGSDSKLQIYVNGTNLINSTQLWDLKRVGDDLHGFVKDSNGGTSVFTIQDQYTTNPVTSFQIYESGTSGAYLTAGLTDAAAGKYQIFAGTDAVDTIDLGSFQKTRAYIFGNAGGDHVLAKDGVTLRFYNDISDGIDTVSYSNASATYLIKTQYLASGTISTNITPDGATVADYFTNVERLHFTDTSLALDVGKGQNAGEIYRLYEAAFDRAPKPVGEGYWLNKLDNGETLVEIANEFTATAEFQKVYGGSAPEYRFYVTELFHHVLGRDPKTAGLDYWSAKLVNGESYGAVLAGISESDENVANVATLIVNGINYAEHL